MQLKTALFAAAALVIPATAFAQAPVRNENLEPACKATGSGMDPRCVGDSSPGTVSDATTAREQRAIQQGVPPAAVSAPSERGAVIERR